MASYWRMWISSSRWPSKPRLAVAYAMSHTMGGAGGSDEAEGGEQLKGERTRGESDVVGSASCERWRIPVPGDEMAASICCNRW